MMDEARKNTLEALRKIHGDNAPGVTMSNNMTTEITPYILCGIMLGIALGLAIGASFS
jgi:hypothetical protein